MSPINLSTCVPVRFSGSPKSYFSKTYCGTFSSLNSHVRSILTSNGRLRKIQTPVDKKKVQFAVPLDDSFKGFAKDYSSQLDEKRYKMSAVREAFISKQRTAVWQTMRKHQGAVPVKIGNKKAFFCSKKLCSNPVINYKGIQDNSDSTILQRGHFLRNNLKPTPMVMMQCKVCARKAYFPSKPQNISYAESFICNDCFVKSKTMRFGALKPLASDIGKKFVLSAIKSVDHDVDQFDDKPIIITSVRSLATQSSPVCPNQNSNPNLETINLEQISSPLQHENMEKTLIKDRNDTLNKSLDLVVGNAKEGTRHEKTITVWTSEGYFTFVVPDKFEHQTDQFKLVSGQNRGTADDPVLIDEY